MSGLASSLVHEPILKLRDFVSDLRICVSPVTANGVNTPSYWVSHTWWGSVRKFLIAGTLLQKQGEIDMGFWTNFGELVLLAVLLGAVTTVVDSVLGVVGLGAMIKKIPVVGSNWTLVVSILMMAILNYDAVAYWGIDMGDSWGGWMGYVANGAIIMGMVPMKDAVISMISKGFRM